MKKQLLTGVLVAVVVAGLGIRAAAQGGARVMVDMKNAQGQSVGSATLTPSGSGVQIAYDFKGLQPGEHALDIHQMAKCEGPAFTTAGGHFNPDMKKHGLQNPEGPHAGDMNNFMVAADGTAKGMTMDPRVTLNPTAANSVFAGGGTALMIHAGADDMKTDPAGNAGDRVACGTITAAK